MRGIGTKYDYDALSYEAPAEGSTSDSYFTATPCRATLHAAEVEARRPAGVISKPASSLLRRALRRG